MSEDLEQRREDLEKAAKQMEKEEKNLKKRKKQLETDRENLQKQQDVRKLGQGVYRSYNLLPNVIIKGGQNTVFHLLCTPTKQGTSPTGLF